MRKQTKHNMKLDKRKIHATWSKKIYAKLWINTFPVSGNGLCRSDNHGSFSFVLFDWNCLGLDRLTDSRLCLYLQLLFWPCVIRKKLVPGVEFNWYNCWLAALETSAKLRSTKRSQSFKVEIYPSCFINNETVGILETKLHQYSHKSRRTRHDSFFCHCVQTKSLTHPRYCSVHLVSLCTNKFILALWSPGMRKAMYGWKADTVCSVQILVWYQIMTISHWKNS